MQSPNSNSYDVIIVGAGFGGCYQLKHFRDEGYKVKLLEAGTGYGGVWHWNAYPGARVDTTIPHYEFSDPKLWEEWSWKQRFPDHTELRAYFDFVADKWDLRKDTQFNSFVESATWNDGDATWTVKTREGDIFQSKHMSLNTGFAAKRYIPDWKGTGSFKGIYIHPSYWPHAGLGTDLHGKKIAVIGTGSTGVQLATELAAIAGHLTVFQRTINTCMPMGQVDFENGDQVFPREDYPEFFKHRASSFGGFNFDFLGRGTFDDDAEKRRQTYEKLWAEGDFKFWLATYYDMLFSKDANREAYNFWRDKTRARINDERVKNLLAPMEQPYSFGCKRISLEDGYFEIFNQPNVSLVDVNATPIQEVTENGIKTSDDKEHEFDIIICATGYDACTGGLRQMDIRGVDGRTLRDHWSTGAYTYLGMTVSGFPNMYMTYAPQGPTALCNGPTCAELQGQWIIDAVKYMREKGLEKMVANAKSEREWRDNVIKIANASLLPSTKSWYMGDNIPGKPREPLIYLGGVSNYYKTVNEVAAGGYRGYSFE
ncbi:hypothetical protein PFICI_04728 [Pestalotiopsis fici W106-1]|uniref:FAD/NAD(P)-binding domain-containing protein n=1 Tax=Pestalotiopsis fici (strain W106-1 / CGMCC3.15140) TaxID=1229662 RepID=W3XBP9_PESFW|nr:uncharacterized protein PFICI_04728 [Pestalotiopsis fici W106-1]ETS82852.1 hypothetical protein PFICI_04728 [Pestalotiopsis fici W106-1]